MSASITRDELLFNTLEKVEELNCSPVFAICQMIKEQVKNLVLQLMQEVVVLYHLKQIHLIMLLNNF